MQSRAAEVLDFWFGHEAFDREVTDRFGSLYEEAVAGELDGWREEPEDCLALVIVLDQFPRNMFRGDARTHATDEKALGAAKYAVERALDRPLAPFQRMFLYMPFMHAEGVEDQRRSVDFFERLAAEPGGPDVVEYAAGHREIVERFGRFPHRNAVLGRETTPGEAEFLTQPGSSY